MRSILLGFALLGPIALGCGSSSNVEEQEDPAPPSSDITLPVDSKSKNRGKPSVAHLHAYKIWHHALYLKATADEAGGTNKELFSELVFW